MESDSRHWLGESCRRSNAEERSSTRPSSRRDVVLRTKVGERPLTSIMAAVQIIPQVELADAEHKAMARTGHRDPGDWPSVAARFNSSTGSKMELSIRAVPVYAYSRLRANGCRYPNL